MTLAVYNDTSVSGLFVDPGDGESRVARVLASGKAAKPDTVAGGLSAAASATGSILFNANASDGDIFFIGTTPVVFVTAAGEALWSAYRNQVVIGTTTALTVAALHTLLAASTDSNLALVTSVVNSNTSKLDFTAAAAGGQGNMIEIAAQFAVAATIVAMTGGADKVSLHVTRKAHYLTVTGGSNQNFVLPDGDDGQEQVLCLLTKGGAGNAVVTPAHFDGSHTTITFTAVNQFIKLVWLAGGWRSETNVGTTIA